MKFTSYHFHLEECSIQRGQHESTTEDSGIFNCASPTGDSGIFNCVTKLDKLETQLAMLGTQPGAQSSRMSKGHRGKRRSPGCSTLRWGSLPRTVKRFDALGSCVTAARSTKTLGHSLPDNPAPLCSCEPGPQVVQAKALSQPRLKAQVCPGLNAGPNFALHGKTSTAVLPKIRHRGVR